MNKLFYSILAASALAVLPAQATIIPSSQGPNNGSQNNDQINPLTVNEGSGTYGFKDWTFAAKSEGMNGLTTGAALTNYDNYQFTLDLGSIDDVNDSFYTGDTRKSGTWEINSDAWSKFDDLLFVLKSGNGVDPDVYQTYLLDGNDVANLGNPLATDGKYLSPFTGGNGNTAQISHFSVYVRGDGTNNGGSGGNNEVPEPSTYAMFGMAFGMFAFLRFRARSRKS